MARSLNENLNREMNSVERHPGEKSNNHLMTKKLNNTSSDEGNNKSSDKIMDLPLIKMQIYGHDFIGLCDTGSSNSVCSEAAFMQIRQKMPKLQILNTCGMYCTLAVGAKRNRIVGQTMLPVKINDNL